MARIQVRVYRPVMGLKPGTVADVEEDDRVLKMIEFGHLRRIVEADAESEIGPEPPADDPEKIQVLP